MIRLLGFMIGVTCCLIMGCVGTASPIRSEVSPRANIVKSGGDTFVRIEERNDNEFSIPWTKVIGLGAAGFGLFGIDKWMFERIRRNKRNR